MRKHSFYWFLWYDFLPITFLESFYLFFLINHYQKIAKFILVYSNFLIHCKLFLNWHFPHDLLVIYQHFLLMCFFIFYLLLFLSWLIRFIWFILVFLFFISLAIKVSFIVLVLKVVKKLLKHFLFDYNFLKKFKQNYLFFLN